MDALSTDVPTPLLSDQNDTNRTVNVFISYAREDLKIAEALRTEIMDLNRDRVDCFLDTKEIQSGEGWERRLESALQKADWLICLFTGEQSEFCGYEVGVFTSGRALERPEDHPRLVCLHDAPNYPTLFRAHQNRSVTYPPENVALGETFDETTFYENSELVRLFVDLSNYKKLYVPRDASDTQRQQQSFIRKAKLITEAFRERHLSDVRFDTPTQLGFEISVPAKMGESLDKIPSNAMAKGTFATFNLFNMMPHMDKDQQLPSVTWGEVRAASQKQSSGYLPWLERLEQDLVNAADQRSLGKAEATFRGVDKTYRAILVRHILHWNGTHRFNVVFVETLPRQFVGDQHTSMILAGLVVASRFRFAFLEQAERNATGFSDTLLLPEFEANYRQFLYDLERMRQESMELGLLDPTTFINSFGASRKAVAEGFLNTWKEARQALDASLPPPNVPLTTATRQPVKAALIKFLDQMAIENKRFLQVALEAYSEELKGELRKAG
jgi:hypothetical protein